MKHFFLILLFSISCLFCQAAPVSEATARFVAGNFFRIQQGTLPEIITLADQEIAFNGTRPVYYIYQMNDNDGFVIVAGDDQVKPVLGYSITGKYIAENQAEQFAKWLEKYRAEIIHIIQNDLPVGDSDAALWHKYRNGETPAELLRASVGPLVNLGWDQAPFYNQLCPSNTVTGCVATAMAMIMRYHSFPATGTGFHSYNEQNYGTLSANFGGTTYDWASMPASLTSNNTALATIMAHCGVAVEMNYGPASSGGSSAYVVSAASPIQHCSEYAYKTYFGYDPNSVSGKMRAEYTDQQWISLMKSELDASRPMQYAGIGSGGGHTWVCDGYDDNNFLHMNWGWSNQNDGFYSVDALNPQSLGAGGGGGGYNSNQQAVIGIKPPGGGGGGTVTTTTLTMNSLMYADPLPLQFALGFTISADFVNASSTPFNGDIACGIFTLDGYFVDFVQGYTGVSVNGNASTGATNFTANDGEVLATPGNYLVYMMYKTGSGNWQAIAPGSFSNPVSVTIAGPDNFMKLNAAISLSPPAFIAGQAASVTTNILNDGFFTYTGTYSAELYDLEGNFVTTIGTLNENQGLPSGYTYLSPFLTFSTNNLNVQPGTYILAMFEQETGSPFPYLLGGDMFTNPITITVSAAAPSPDQYENNDTEGAAALLPLSFSGNNAAITSIGSNFHIGSDNDFYFLNLDPGFDYIITARLHDSNNSGNGQTYTVDGVFTIFTSQGQSDAIDDVSPGNFLLSGNQQVLFKVSPLFTGGVGAYLLDIQVQRGSVGMNDNNELKVNVYPNPAMYSFFVDFPASSELNTIDLISPTGQLVKTINVKASQGKVQVQVEGLASGIYMLRGNGASGSFNKTISIQN